MIATTGLHTLDVIFVILIAVLLVASGMLALAETSLVRMTRVKAKSMVDQKRRGSRQLARLTEQPAQFLNPILLLVLICQLVSATLLGVVAEHVLGGIGVLVGAVIAGNEPNASFGHDAFRFGLGAHRSNRCGRRSDKDEARRRCRRGECLVLR